jgi:putative addiction module component (TIGR02574 family)
MTAKAKKVLEAALELTPRARGDLAASLIESLDEGADPGAARAWDLEIDRRLDLLEAGRAQTVAWSAVEAGLGKTRRGVKRR